ncbi:hypothetical protein ABW19_dt0205113 [Dactylella cylindrospora]|nr:hypothetical protein ABW19_dt0205113 [Dactylella cylindrospora]
MVLSSLVVARTTWSIGAGVVGFASIDSRNGVVCPTTGLEAACWRVFRISSFLALTFSRFSAALATDHGLLGGFFRPLALRGDDVWIEATEPVGSALVHNILGLAVVGIILELDKRCRDVVVGMDELDMRRMAREDDRLQAIGCKEPGEGSPGGIPRMR